MFARVAEELPSVGDGPAQALSQPDLVVDSELRKLGADVRYIEMVIQFQPLATQSFHESIRRGGLADDLGDSEEASDVGSRLCDESFCFILLTFILLAFILCFFVAGWRTVARPLSSKAILYCNKANIRWALSRLGLHSVAQRHTIRCCLMQVVQQFDNMSEDILGIPQPILERKGRRRYVQGANIARP